MSIQTYLTKRESIKPILFYRAYLAKEELEAVLDCLLEDEFTTETIREKFEKLFCETLNFKHALAVNAKTSAYHLAFLSLKINETNTIWMSNLAPVSALDAAKYINAKICLIEIDKNSFFPNPDHLKEIITKEMKENDVFIADYTYGAYYEFPFDLLQEKNIHVIEDITGMLGFQISINEDEVNGNIGKFSKIQICGLYPDDIITTAKGAIILTNDNKIIKELNEITYSKNRNLNKTAFDYLLEDFQSAIGIHQLNKIGNLLTRRKKIGHKFLEGLRNTHHETYFQNPKYDNYHRFPVVFSKSQEEMTRYFKSLKIEVQPIPTPLHKYLNETFQKFPNSERLLKKGLCIPIYPMLTSGNVERIINAIRSII
ncbi:MAG: DegT/DnrJ/EryC1/StrS family aminotransferase [Leptospiraceae bacterium]|nr:DegT/DnrJ/EryC1/StrS family aminotransferase [Leptospiraceae bacterium]MDW7976547.1 DegT/DnrJ/EryC1/StrS family aminotransferase [Leptospiraceae bacterium]